MMSSYHAVLAAVSVGLGTLAVLAGLRVATRIAETEGWSRVAWWLLGIPPLAAGLWSLHLVVVSTRFIPTAASYGDPAGVVSIGLAALAALLLVAGGAPPRAPRILTLGALAGLLVTAMHFSGVDAVVGPRPVAIDAILGAVGVAVAMAATTCLVWLTSRADGAKRPRRLWAEHLSALALGGALAGALYASLQALRWRSAPAAESDGSLPGLLSGDLVVPAVAASLLFLLGVVIAALVDGRVRRRRAETEALRRSEDRFRSLAEASSQIVWTTAPDGQMVGEQLSWAEFTGQSREEYRGWGWFNAVHPEDREGTARRWEATLAERRSAEIEHRVRRRDGRYRDCLARVVPVVEDDGRVREWVGTHTDVTDHARMKEERDLMAEAGRVLASSLDPGETLGAVARLIVPRLADWCVVDLRTGEDRLERVVATHVDPQKAFLLRQNPLLLEGDHGPARVARTEQSELVQQVSDAVLREITADPQHLSLLREVGLASILSVPLLARGQVLGMLTLALSGEEEHYDLRDLAFAEELARRSATAIDNARLYSGAQRAIQDRDEILGVVSHDLRNPLNVITLSSELLIEAQLSPDLHRRQLEIIRRSARAMNRLIQDLLDVSRMDAGGLSIDTQREDPGSVIAEACDLMRPLAEERGHSFTCSVAAELPPVEMDRGRIQQVLSNLIGNAIKFMEPGGAVHVQGEPSREGVRISVMDTGPGIEPGNLPRLFERHWQARGTAHMGAGLGLAIAKGIVEAHGGRIAAESSLGRGTCIHFLLPAAADGREPWPHAPVPEEPAESAPEAAPV